MTGGFERVRSGVLAVVDEVRREDVTFMAASIAYHAFVSMLPVLLLLTIAVSAFGSEEFVGAVIELTEAALPETGQSIVTEALANATGGVGLSVVGVLVLLWGTSKIFRAMDAAFAEIYDTERELSLLGQLRDAIVVVVTVGGAVVGAVVIGTVVAFPASVPFAAPLTRLLAVLGLAVALFPVYYVFPNVDLSAREALPGVAVAAVGWVGLEWLFDLYVAASSKPDLFGLLGSLVLLVTWLYVGGLVLLVGAAVNATLAGRNVEARTERHDKRRFGRQISDVTDFEERVDELVVRARDAGVQAQEIRRALVRRAEETGRRPTEENAGRRSETTERR